MTKIFISIASYRDPQLLPTLRDCIANADKPENLVFSIAWQRCKLDLWDNLKEFKEDPRFRIIDINYEESKGACWARSEVQKNYQDEEYYLQIDSHHRFVKHWDTECIKMIKQLQKKGHNKPLLTCYATSFNPDNDPEEREKAPWWMTFDRFIPEGAIFFLPAAIPYWEHRKEPIPSRFLSAHFIFTLGKWVKEVPYDPDYYFHGEEISLAVRSYTWGYDLFHPHKIMVYHEYTRRGRAKVWDDDRQWTEKNILSHKKNRALFGMDGQRRDDFDFSKYDFGKQRSLAQYEAYAGINFEKRAVQQYTLDNNFAPNPFITDPLEYRESFKQVFKHCIDIYPSQVPHGDYDFWVVAFENEQGDTIYRQDANIEELNSIANDPDGYYKVWRIFNIDEKTGKPYRWIVWPHSEKEGWCDRITGELPR
jgi:hypothetical protein